MKQALNHIILGTGQLGLAIMDELVAAGEPVRLVNRSGKVDEKLPAGVELVTADVTDPAQVAAVCEGAEIVFFCVQPPYHRWPELFPKLAAGVIDGLSGSGTKLVFGSNVYAYGPTGGPPDPRRASLRGRNPQRAGQSRGGQDAAAGPSRGSGCGHHRPSGRLFWTARDPVDGRRASI